MIGNLIGPEIKELVEARNFVALREIFEDWSPADIAECILDLPQEEQVIIFRLLPHALATEVLEYLDSDAQHHLLKAMGQEAAVRILNDMSPDDRTQFLEELPGEAVAQMLTLLSPEERAIAQGLLNYPEDSVGRLMTPDFVSVRGDWTIQQVLDYIREHGKNSETLNVIYVTDEKGRLQDDLRIREILLRPVTTLVSEIHDTPWVALRATDDSETAIATFKKYDRNTLPVIDSEAKLLGIVTIDDILDVYEEQTTEDIQKLGGMEALDEPYMAISLRGMIQKRGTWLVVLFLSEMLTTTVMGRYEKEIGHLAMLATFLPLIISSGGNSGSQATTLIIRAMALSEVRLRDWWKVARREAAAGLSLGLLLGGLGFSRIYVWHELHLHDYGPHPVLIALTVGIALVGVVMWGTLTGSMLPFLLRRCGLDPASSSAPFVATLVDVTGLLIYFNAAFLILPKYLFQ